MTIDMPGGGKIQVVGAGQKSGQYWMLDAATGAVLWHTQVGPGSTLGMERQANPYVREALALAG